MLRVKSLQRARIKSLHGTRIKGLQEITKGQNVQPAEDRDQKREIVIKPIVGVGGL